MGKSSSTVMDAEMSPSGQLSANQAFCQTAPKPAAPAASDAMNMSGNEVMEGIRKKLTPSQEPKNSIHQAKSLRNSTLRRIG